MLPDPAGRLRRAVFFLAGPWVQTATRVWRAEFLRELASNVQGRRAHIDLQRSLYVAASARAGRASIRLFDAVTSVYQEHRGGIWTGRSACHGLASDVHILEFQNAFFTYGSTSADRTYVSPEPGRDLGDLSVPVRGGVNGAVSSVSAQCDSRSPHLPARCSHFVQGLNLMTHELSNCELPCQIPPPLLSRTQEVICASWQSDGPPLVSVLCATYNHVSFIEDAIAGFLGQITDFPFEVIVRDDASTDGTSDIIKRYANSHPRIIKPILEKYNTYSSRRPFPAMLAASSGRYIALCEGDDYWTDPHKLALQLGVMNSDPCIALVSTHALHIEGDKVIGMSTAGGTRTYFFRRFDGFPKHREQYIYLVDSFIIAALSDIGRMEVLPKITAVWRKHPGGIWSSLVDGDVPLLQMRRGLTQFWLSEYFLKKGDAERARIHLISSVNQMIAAYPNLSRSVKFRAVLLWVTPKLIFRVFRFLGRKARSIVARL